MKYNMAPSKTYLFCIGPLVILATASARGEPPHSQVVTTIKPVTLSIKTLIAIKELTSKVCPYTSYCRKGSMTDFTEAVADSFPCCANCSCEDDCWETRTCCPDKEVFYEREPISNCHVSIVKMAADETFSDMYNGIHDGVLAYQIIDRCPESEQNISIINKCTLIDIDHVEDYRWVFDNSSGNIYQNKFCAACHRKTEVTEWQLETTCEDVLFSNFSDINSLLLSDRCDIRNTEPDRVISSQKRCVIPYFTQCNQTGLWRNYDPDIVWACDVHNAVYMETDTRPQSIYKNAFCYACNQPDINYAPTVCRSSSIIGPSRRLSAFIDSKRNAYFGNKQNSSGTGCEVNEIMDPYLQKCRILICPFGSTPVNGSCEQLVEITYGLTVETIYKLSVLWSKRNYLLTDDMTILTSLGTKIYQGIHKKYACKEAGECCPSCVQEMAFVKEIRQSNGSYDPLSTQRSEENTNNGISTEPNFIFYSIPYTEKNCQLTNLLQNAIKLAGTVIEIVENGKTDMVLQVDLTQETAMSMMKGAPTIVSEGTGAKCYVIYKLATDKICSSIRINFSDFGQFFADHNTDSIKFMFTEAQMRSDEFREICVDEYLENLSQLTNTTTTTDGSFKLCLKGFLMIDMIVLTQLL